MNIAITENDYQNAQIAAENLVLISTVEQAVGWAQMLVEDFNVPDISSALTILANQRTGCWHPVVDLPGHAPTLCILPGWPPESEARHD